MIISENSLRRSLTFNPPSYAGEFDSTRDILAKGVRYSMTYFYCSTFYIGSCAFVYAFVSSFILEKLCFVYCYSTGTLGKVVW